MGFASLQRPVGWLRTVVWLSAGLVVAVGASACLSTDADDMPMSARVRITGDAPTPLQLVISTNFFEQLVGDGTEIEAVLVSADTITPSLPFDQNFTLNDLGSVLVRLIQPDTTPSNVTLQVLLDGNLEYDQTATISQGAALEYRFVFTPLF